MKASQKTWTQIFTVPLIVKVGTFPMPIDNIYIIVIERNAVIWKQTVANNPKIRRHLAYGKWEKMDTKYHTLYNWL